MRRLAWLVVLAACGDNLSLDIVVEPMPNKDYQALVQKVVVTVYQSELDDLNCDMVELGDVTPERLLGSKVAEQIVDKTGARQGQLDDIPRVGRKIVVARGLSMTGVLVGAGCKEVGEVDGALTIAIPLTVAATVAFDSLDTPSMTDPYGKLVTIVDPLGESLVGREVRWRVFGPAGAEPTTMTGVTRDPTDPTRWNSTSPVCTGTFGSINVHPTPPAKVGGFAARIRVAWTANDLPLYSGFVRPGVGLRALANPPAANRCAIRTNGEKKLICLEGGGAQMKAHRLAVQALPSKNYVLVDQSQVDTPNAVGAVAVEESGGQEVYAILPNASLLKLFGTGAGFTSTCTDCDIDDFKVLPQCGNKSLKILLHSRTGAAIRVIDLGDSPLRLRDFATGDLPNSNVELNAGGCVTQIDANGMETLHQVSVLDFNSGLTTRALFDCGGGRACNVPLPFPEAAVGFFSAGTAAKPERQMLGTRFDANGADLIGWVLRPAGDGYHLIERQHIRSAAQPTRVLAGRLDMDMEPDLVWSIKGNRSTIIEASYGHALEDGTRLNVLSAIAQVDEIILGDLTGDGFDDLVGTGPSVVAVVPTNVAGPDVPLQTDTPCP